MLMPAPSLLRQSPDARIGPVRVCAGCALQCNAIGVRDPGRLRIIFSLRSCVWFRGIPIVTSNAYCEDGPIPDSGTGVLVQPSVHCKATALLFFAGVLHVVQQRFS